MAHLPGISEWESVEQGIQDMEDRVLASAFVLMDSQPQSGMVCEQMNLPHVHAGLGLRCTRALECHAGDMSAVARAQIAMSERSRGIPAPSGINGQVGSMRALERGKMRSMIALERGKHGKRESTRAWEDEKHESIRAWEG
jgi:hypothetical protein